jgi:hypothetical protein
MLLHKNQGRHRAPWFVAGSGTKAVPAIKRIDGLT